MADRIVAPLCAKLAVRDTRAGCCERSACTAEGVRYRQFRTHVVTQLNMNSVQCSAAMVRSRSAQHCAMRCEQSRARARALRFASRGLGAILAMVWRTQYQISSLDQSSKPSQLRICSTSLGFTIPPSLLRLFCNTHQLRHHNGHWRTSHNLMRLTPYSPIPARLHGLPWFCKALFRHVVIDCIPSPPD